MTAEYTLWDAVESPRVFRSQAYVAPVDRMEIGYGLAIGCGENRNLDCMRRTPHVLNRTFVIIPSSNRSILYVHGHNVDTGVKGSTIARNDQARMVCAHIVTTHRRQYIVVQRVGANEWHESSCRNTSVSMC